MNNALVFNRFATETHQRVIQNIEQKPVGEDELIEQASFSEAVSPELLRERLLKEFAPEPVKVQAEPISEPLKIELVHFANVFEFATWYENNRRFFSENQRVPLDTLVEAKNITMGGCNCDRGKRVMIAEDYFRNFWTKNKGTDLMSTLQNVLNTKKVILGDFLVFPE